MDATMVKGQVFRHLFVGALHDLGGRLHTSRITWVLERGGDEARLTVFCERFFRGPGKPKKAHVPGSERTPFLLGEANRRDLWWAAPATSVYVAPSGPSPEQTTVSKSRFELHSFRESARSHELGAGAPSCGIMPKHLTFVCETAAILVRPQGAHLAYLPLQRENQYDARWIPPTRSTVRGLRCSVPEFAKPHPRPPETFIEKLPQPWAPGTQENAPLFFAERTDQSPGVEFVYANHDAGMETGDYRWILVQ